MKIDIKTKHVRIIYEHKELFINVKIMNKEINFNIENKLNGLNALFGPD